MAGQRELPTITISDDAEFGGPYTLKFSIPTVDGVIGAEVDPHLTEPESDSNSNCATLPMLDDIFNDLAQSATLAEYMQQFEPFLNLASHY